ncbi:MAG: hypothetical protein PUF50_04245 [Erysipelotrichaceae bacterium]|nr:hypothetical protein [Erysipelotrichaceae bacterium]
MVKSDYTYLTDSKTEDFYGFAYELPCQCNESIQLIAEIEGIPFDLYPIFSEKGKTYGCDAEFLYIEKEGCLLVKPTNGMEKGNYSLMRDLNTFAVN